MLKIKLTILCLFLPLILSAQQKIKVDVSNLDISGYDHNYVFISNGRTLTPFPADKEIIEIEVEQLPTLVSLEHLKKNKFINYKTFWLENNELFISGNMAKKNIESNKQTPLQDIANTITHKSKPDPKKAPELTYSLPYLVHINRQKSFLKNSYLNQVLMFAPEDVKNFWAFEEIGDFIEAQNNIDFDPKTKVLRQLIAVNKEKEPVQTTMDGKPLLIDFSSSSCRPCILDIPKMVKIHEQYSDKLDMLTVWKDKTYETWINTSTKYKDLILWNSLWDQSGAVFQKFDIKTYPNYWLFDKNGKLVKTWNRPPKNLEKYL